MGSKLNGSCGCGKSQCDRGHPVAFAAAAMLDQCAAFIRDLPESTYARESRSMKGTIGKHVRHSLDHFKAALNAGEDGVIDYDHRAREVPMETDPNVALRAIEDLKSFVKGLDAESMSARVRIRVMVTGDGTETELDSTLARELAFASHHAIHHHAMLGAIAAELGVPVSEDFGKAPSTISYEKARG